MMNELASIVNEIGSTSSRNDKEMLLRKYENKKHFKELMQFIYNPYIRTGIAKAKLTKATKTLAFTVTLEEVMTYFKEHSTGSAADATYAINFVDQHEGPARDLAIAIVTKNLKIGVTAKTLNKVYGKAFIPMIGIMKADKYDECKEKVKGPFIVTEKLDGARRILIKENGKVAMYSRSGIPDDGLYEIEEEAVHLPDNAVYDGELLAKGEFDNAIELRQATNSIANSKGKRNGLTFNIFDMVDIDEFKSGKSEQGALIRKAVVAALFGEPGLKHIITPAAALEHITLKHELKHILPVPILGIANNEEEVIQFAEPIWQRGFEGVMLNTYSGKYEVDKRVKSVLKVKNIIEDVVTVIDVEKGKPGTKNEHRLGALVFEYKGNRVGCGSGLDDANRDKWWDDPSLIVGKKIEIEHFGESTNKQGGVSLNCPIFKRVVGEA